MASSGQSLSTPASATVNTITATSSHANPRKHHRTTVQHSTTIRSLPWTYLHLSLISEGTVAEVEVDEITARTSLTAALGRFLGLTGEAMAMSVDILKVQGRDVWVRVPKEDGNAVAEALAGWSSPSSSGGGGGGGGGRVGGVTAWRIKGRSEWLGALVAGNGRELFEA